MHLNFARPTVNTNLRTTCRLRTRHKANETRYLSVLLPDVSFWIKPAAKLAKIFFRFLITALIFDVQQLEK